MVQLEKTNSNKDDISNILLIIAVLITSVTSVVLVVKTRSRGWEAIALLGSLLYVLLKIPYKIMKEWVFEETIENMVSIKQ